MKLFLAAVLFLTVYLNASDLPVLSNKAVTIGYNGKMHSRITVNLSGTKPLMNNFYPSEQLILRDKNISDFRLESVNNFDSEKSTGIKIIGTYSDDNYKISKEVVVEYLKEFPEFLLTRVKYINNGKETIDVEAWVNNSYSVIPDNKTEPSFWSFQGATYPDRRDWVLPVNEGFSQENYMGMNASDYGGGTPVTDLWRTDGGMAVGHLEMTPKLVSIPVEYKNHEEGANIRVSFKYPEEKKLAPGESIETYQTFVAVHKGDYFNTLKNFSDIMVLRGIRFQEYTSAVYESEWCAWGYERDFTIDEVLGTLPKVAELGYKWATLDDGWQTAEGDWYLNPKRFPNGDKDMKAFVDKIHQKDLKAMLWWAPLAVDPGTDLIKNHEDYLLLNEDGSKQDITWWDSYYLCPAYEPVIDFHVALVKKIMSEWGYEGLKIDGQHLNAAPPCYNKAHNHARPEEAAEKLPEFYKAIIETALNINPDAVIQICPCGTSYSFYNLPYMNQTVSSDPLSSWQIRLKGKTLKALMGTNSPYFGDHVELSDKGSDFASTVGIGGIVGTKFTHPTDRLEHKNYLLTEEKEKEWKKWLDIYNENKLAEGNYRGGLYDIGYHKPETHVVQKGDTMYYAFYSDKWNGDIQLKGLDNTKYRIFDYVENKEITEVDGSSAKLNVKFDKFLLVKAVPVNN